jgi:hypothetical protein
MMTALLILMFGLFGFVLACWWLGRKAAQNDDSVQANPSAAPPQEKVFDTPDTTPSSPRLETEEERESRLDREADERMESEGCPNCRDDGR